MDRLLASKWALHDVDDVEALVRRSLDDRLSRWGAWLREDDYRDCVGTLFVAVWQASVKYDGTGCSSFSKLVWTISQRRAIDFLRKLLGDTRHAARREQPLSLDAALFGADDDEQADQWARLERAFAASAGDGTAAFSIDQPGLFD